MRAFCFLLSFNKKEGQQGPLTRVCELTSTTNQNKSRDRFVLHFITAEKFQLNKKPLKARHTLQIHNTKAIYHPFSKDIALLQCYTFSATLQNWKGFSFLTKKPHSFQLKFNHKPRGAFMFKFSKRSRKLS